MTDEVLTVAGRPKPLDLVLFERFKREIPGLVEATLDRNYGLADLGPMLPVGTEITVTVPAPAPTKTARKVVKLYD